MAPVIDVRRAAERFSTRTEWLASRHSFSFGEHYDPANVGFAALVAHNDDVVAVGAGYDTHPHADTEIVTWVLEGSLVHLDSRGGSHVLVQGSVQLLSAGSGVLHSERNDAPGAARPTRFVQMWLRPDASVGSTPRSASTRPVRLCTSLDSRRASPWVCRTPRTCTCSSPMGASTSPGPVASPKETPPGAPVKADRASPRTNPPSSSSGSSTLRSPDEPAVRSPAPRRPRRPEAPRADDPAAAASTGGRRCRSPRRRCRDRRRRPAAASPAAGPEAVRPA
jgi:hypothetical protein